MYYYYEAPCTSCIKTHLHTLQGLNSPLQGHAATSTKRLPPCSARQKQKYILD